MDRAVEDRSGDGIPDRKKRSTSFHDRLTSRFGPDQFEGLEVDRQDLLVDVRYVGPVQVTPETKARVVDVFRANGVHAQWLDYPGRYSLDEVIRRYGTTVKDLLWDRGSFYAEVVESDLKDVAVQLIVVPGVENGDGVGRVYSHWIDVASRDRSDGFVNGFSAGNRAVVAVRDDPREQARLIVHELAHLVLCHDDDPTNTGVMGTNAEIDLLDREWERFRNGLSNVRDTTGYDFAIRPCLWEENLTRVLGD